MTEELHHVGITVSDLDTAVAFYRDVLDLDVLDRFTVSGEGFSTGVGVPDATGQFAYLDGDGTRVELVEYDPTGEDHGEESVNDLGAAHLGLAVADVAAVYEGLPDDVETISEPQTTSSGAVILFVRDPDGNLVELIEK